ncbi:MAG: 2-hydroxychromene-2-carboxylate isomerase [Pikeienuella sp.]
MSAGTIEAWVEFASTYSYPAAMRAERAAEAAGLRLVWRPFLLGPIFAAQGWSDSPFNIHPAKGRYMIRDLERVCAQLGLPFKMPARFPAHSLLAARVATVGDGAPWQGAFIRAVFAKGFGEGRDIAERGVIAEALAWAGGPADAVDRATGAEPKAALRNRVEEAVAHGIFGAPSFRVGTELFWGHDRLEAAIDWARQTRSDGVGR